MAKSDSNRDRIGKMFELLAPPLDEFITRIVEPVLGEGVDWAQLVAAKDGKKVPSAKSYDRRDPQVQLRMITENVAQQARKGWRPFDGQLGPTQRLYASELRDARNAWAHMKSFSDDDAYRILDTAERFLNGIGSSDAAGDVRKLRLELRRVASDKDDRRVLKSALVVPQSEGLVPWRDVLRPHDDVATGNFQASEFAADLYKVSVAGEEAGSDYADPVTFFSRTYLTEGLRDLIGRAVRRLSGDDNASPVINLQTNFGGGKTHSMLALWHLAAGLAVTDYGQEMQELLGESGYDALPEVKRVALVGNHISPAGSTKPDGTKVNTLWGELAWQLGGAEGYAMVARSDQERTPPGEALHQLISTYAPTVILIDEWVAYARSLVTRTDLAAGSFDDQFTFAQSLTEAVKGTPGVLLAISIPASENGDEGQLVAEGNAEEVGGAHGLEALQRLQNVVRRVADQWRPASADESYHIVRQRLFVPVDAEALATISATARKFGELYRGKSQDEFPREARDIAYEERIKRTYPIHPELFDRLYEDWSGLERFQRTRGVLRLMNTVIHALWVGGDQSPLIMPASVPLSTAAVNAELTQYLHDSWKAVIDADVDGANSEPAKIDTEKPLFGAKSVTQRLARTVFVGAAPTIGTAQKGIAAQRVFLGAAVPGDTVGNFHAALGQLSDRGTYFYADSGKYWYDLQANISRRAKDHADRIHKEEVWGEIVDRLKRQAKKPAAFAGVHVCPEETGDIPDLEEARLVIVHPRLTYRRGDSTALAFAAEAAEQRGGASRVNRNMLVFLAADDSRMEELDRAVRTYLGWTDVLAKHRELDLTENQREQAADRRRQASEVVDSRLLGSYQWALVPQGQPISIATTKVEGQTTSLAERVSRRLENDGALSTQQAAAAIRHQLDGQAAPLWKDGHVSVGDLWKTYAQYPYMPRLTDRSVLQEGLQRPPILWEQDGFALADGYEEAKKRYHGLVLPSDDEQLVHITDQTLIVRPDVALAQRSEERAEEADGSAGVGGSLVVTSPEGQVSGDTEEEGQSPGSKKVRYFATKHLSSERYALDFKNVADEVLAHLAAAPGVTVSVNLEIEASAIEGFDEDQVRVISENATTLKFEQSSFEEE